MGGQGKDLEPELGFVNRSGALAPQLLPQSESPTEAPGEAPLLQVCSQGPTPAASFLSTGCPGARLCWGDWRAEAGLVASPTLGTLQLAVPASLLVLPGDRLGHTGSPQPALVLGKSLPARLPGEMGFPGPWPVRLL